VDAVRTFGDVEDSWDIHWEKISLRVGGWLGL